MKFYQLVVVLSAVSLVGLAGCSQSEKSGSSSSMSGAPTETSQKPADSGSTSTVTPQASSKSASDASQNFSALLVVVTKTQAAVNANDYKEAQTEFDKFEDSWSKVEDGVKAKSSDTYNAIEDNADQVKSALKASDKTKALAALKNLNTSVASASKS